LLGPLQPLQFKGEGTTSHVSIEDILDAELVADCIDEIDDCCKLRLGQNVISTLINVNPIPMQLLALSGLGAYA
jgi:hypothetical protein